LLGSDYDNSPYTQAGERVSRLAMSGIRLVIDEFRTDVTKTPQERLQWQAADRLRRRPSARGGGEVAMEVHRRREDRRRALRPRAGVITAEQYASRLVVPQSQRSHPSSWASHKDHAAKALKKLAGPHLPGSLRQLETAIKRTR
jgi:hypothetical protein